MNFCEARYLGGQAVPGIRRNARQQQLERVRVRVDRQHPPAAAEKFEVKYHLRTYEDALAVLFMADNRFDKGHKLDYSELSAAERRIANGELLTKLFPNDAKKRLLHTLALDISADLRVLH